MDKNLSALAPANGANAVVNAAFAIELDNPAPDPSLVAGFSALAPQLAEDAFDPPQQQQLFSLTFGPQMAASQNVVGLAGYVYQKRSPAGQPTIEFALRGNSISVVVYQYTRWHLIWPVVHKLFERVAVLLAANQARSVRSVAMQYIDKFTWREEGGAFPTKDVLRGSSPHFAPAVLEKAGPWHSNVGYEVQYQDGWAGNRLDNLNVSVVAEGGYPALTIFTIYRYFARVAAKEPPEFVTAIIPGLFETVHSDNKQQLREILVDGVCERINLEGRG